MFESEVREPPVHAYLPSVVDALLSPDDVAGWCATAAPGPVTAELIAVLDPARLSDAGRVDLLVATERLGSWVAAVSHRTVAAMAAVDAAAADAPREPDGELTDLDAAVRESYLRETLMCALRVGRNTAMGRVLTAQALTGPLRATLGALHTGAVTPFQAVLLAEHTTLLPDAVQAAVQDRVLPAAGEQSYAQFRRALRRAVGAVDTRDAARQHADAVAERRVVKTAQADGMATIWALLPADGAELVYAALTGLADQACGTDQAGGDGRLVDQRRADALVDLACAALTDPALPRRHGKRPTITVTVALSTLLGADDLPGELDGHGAIPAVLARQLAHDPTGTWRRLITDPAGGLLDYGRTTYTPPPPLAEHIIARDRTCVFPRCGVAARRSDLDHRRAWADGGHTSAANMNAVCERHHTMKHTTPWTYQPADHGAGIIWTSPTGHTYRTRPDPYPIPELQADPPPDPPDDEPPPF